jgi:uncharacterized membrane protein
MSGELTLLRLLHIIPGAFWVGTALFVAFVLEPVTRKLGPHVEQPLFARLGKTMGPIMTVNGLVTIGLGLALVARTPGRGFDQLFSTGWGMAIGIGLVASVGAFAAGLVTGIQAAGISRVAASFAPGAAPSAEKIAQIEAYKGRLRLLSRANAVLVTVAIGTMAAARFV